MRADAEAVAAMRARLARRQEERRFEKKKLNKEMKR